MNPPKIATMRRERGDALAEDIAWFRSFGWSTERIARRLGVTVSCVEKRERRAA